MYKDIKAKWVYALRSGDYEQGLGKLRKDDKFCCLGVLCDIHSKETGTEWIKEKYFKNILLLPDIVVFWANLKTETPNVYVNKNRNSLVELNDNRMTFLEIADLIEEQL